MLPRKKTRQVTIGNVKIGGDAPVALQTMTSGYRRGACDAHVQSESMLPDRPQADHAARGTRGV